MLEYAKGSNRVQSVRIRPVDPVDCPLAALNFYIWEAIRKVSGRDLMQMALQSNHNFQLFDKVLGSDSTRKQMTAGWPAWRIVGSWAADETQFLARRRLYLNPNYQERSASLTSSASKKKTVNPHVHVVSEGESLYGIARKYQCSVKDLLRLNPAVVPSRLSIGTRLILPN